MANMFQAEKMPKQLKDRWPLLPRIGLVVDFAGTKYSYKYVSVVETMATMLSEGPITLSRFKKLISTQFKEIEFPSMKASQVVDTTAKSHGTIQTSNLDT
ncbi:MAG: hypothetical protein WCI18_04535 [Pseudomonadota bacterium]